MNDMKRAWVEIDIDAVEHNVKEIKGLLKGSTRLMGVVKADAYGHGVIETAEVILESGADELAVAYIDEAIQIRKGGINVPVLILGSSSCDVTPELVEYNIMPSVYDRTFAEALSREAVSQNKTAKIHIKVDTGMSRIGFLYDSSEENRQKAFDEIMYISKLPNIFVEGIFTHFASSDEKDRTYTYMQFERFKSLTDRLEKGGLKIPTRHVCNSAAIMQFPEMHLDMVRAGVIMYGLYPSDEVDKNAAGLIPAMSLKTRVIHVKEVCEGTSVSYGRTFKTQKKTKLATIAIGYADGYSRLLSGKAEILVSGQRARQVGRICMDQCMIDASDVNNINVGDVVTLFGSDSGAVLPVEEIAGKIGTVNYEIVCVVGKRIPRIYIKNGKIVKALNYLLGEYDL